MNNNDFFKNLDFRYPEIVECLKKNGKEFYVPIVMGLVDDAGLDPKEKKIPNTSSKIKNKVNNLEISKITKYNYINLEVPSYLWYPDYETTGIKYKKGDKFIVIFVGGDIDKIRIVGRY